MTNKTPVYTLITGAGRGLGRALAEACAQEGLPLLLTSLAGEDLPATAAALHTRYRLEVHHLELDLTRPGAPEELLRWTHDHGFTVRHLINNAGLGSVGPFTSKDAAFLTRQIDLNVRVPVVLTRLFIDELARLPRSRILNIASMAGLTPMPYKVTYSNTKRFLQGFSLALRQEYLHTPLRVCVAIPGPVRTNDMVIRRINDQGFWGRAITWYPEKVAPIIIRGMLKGKAVILPGFYEKFSFLAEKLIPSPAKLWLITRSFGDNPPS